MQRKQRILSFLLALAPVCHAQMLDPARLKQPPTDMWPTYHGDYSGRRYSPLKQIHSANVKGLTLAWMAKTDSIPDGARIGGSGAEPNPNAPATIKGVPLMVNGVLYLTATNQGFAIDARTGRQLWHYIWRGVPAFSLGNRGFGMSGDWLFFESADNYLISLDAKTGKERWNKQMADVKRDYFSSLPPLIVKNHVITGVGGDFLDIPNFAQARDPETGDVQWNFWTTAHQGDPGFSTWPDAKAVEHGGGGIWIPPTYDPELNLVYIGTGNVNPVFAGQSRPGDNLYTCSVVALNADTGKLVWHFQFSPHDTHDWDAAQVPVLFDGVINGQPRKLLAQAYRGGLFFVLDRTNGKSLLTAPMVEGLNWYKGIAPNGQPVRDPAKEPTIPGSLVAPSSGGVTNWPSPSFNPDTGLFYVGTSLSWAIFYLTDADPQPEGYGGTEAGVGGLGGVLRAIDYKTGKTVWQRKTGNGAQGLLSTAGNLLFGSDGYDNFIAFDAKTGEPLWHAGLLSNPSNAPQTYMLDGRQYVAVAAGEYLYTFVLQE